MSLVPNMLSQVAERLHFSHLMVYSPQTLLSFDLGLGLLRLSAANALIFNLLYFYGYGLDFLLYDISGLDLIRTLFVLIAKITAIAELTNIIYDVISIFFENSNDADSNLFLELLVFGNPILNGILLFITLPGPQLYFGPGILQLIPSIGFAAYHINANM